MRENGHDRNSRQRWQYDVCKATITAAVGFAAWRQIPVPVHAFAEVALTLRTFALEAASSSQSRNSGRWERLAVFVRDDDEVRGAWDRPLSPGVRSASGVLDHRVAAHRALPGLTDFFLMLGIYPEPRKSARINGHPQ